LRRVVSKAESKFASQAYLHHYYAYGLNEDFFESAFVALEQVLLDYGNI
jgi:hypothetical protein